MRQWQWDTEKCKPTFSTLQSKIVSKICVKNFYGYSFKENRYSFKENSKIVSKISNHNSYQRYLIFIKINFATI